jgi:protein-tyrosine phosphatase
MIDLHSHVLPGIDDGPDELAESVEFLRAAAAQGTTVLAATPHARDDHPLVDLERLEADCASLNEQLPANTDITVIPAAEVDLLWAQRASDEELRLASFGQAGKDLLLETPYGELPDTFEALVFQVSVRGYRLLLAHPERNPTFQRDPLRLRELVDRGVLLQITLPALMRSDRRSRSRKLALDLVREGIAHNLASDAHSAGPWRPPDLRAGLAALADVAPLRAEWMVTEAPAAILAGEPLPRAPEERVRSGRRLKLPNWLGGN